jgi:hypothetical protein
VYGNEALVGEAIQPWLQEHGRDSLFLTSKVWNDAHRPQLLRCVCHSAGRRAALQHWHVVSEQDVKEAARASGWHRAAIIIRMQLCEGVATCEFAGLLHGASYVRLLAVGTL